MLPSKRGADDFTRLSADNKRTCSREEATGLWISDIWDELSEEVASKLSRSVVSIALSAGQSVLYASSGIFIERQGYFTKFVTSASLVRALHDSETKFHDKLEIKVCHEGNVAVGCLEENDLDYEIAVVKVMSVLNKVDYMPLNHQVQFDPHGRKVVAVGCDISGRVLAKSGICTDSRGSQYSRYAMFSTCKLSETNFLAKEYNSRTFGSFSYILEKECISKPGEASQGCKRTKTHRCEPFPPCWRYH